MNLLYSAIITIASGLLVFLFPGNSSYTDFRYALVTDSITWQDKGIQWLIKSQSPDGGWGHGSHDNQSGIQVRTDPATTALIGKALLKAGGDLNSNPYKKEIFHAH